MRRVWGAAVVVALVVGGACSSDDGESGDDRKDGQTAKAEEQRGKGVARPTVTGPITGGKYGVPFNPLPKRLADKYHYREDEYFVSGTATAYEPDGTWGLDGAWKAKPGTTADYTTRVVVRRPEDPKDFNGTVLVEWLNVTAGMDSDPDFGFTHDLLLHDGWAYVGVSAQKGGVEGGGGLQIDIPGFDPEPLKPWDPERYGELSHPGDQYSYDIYSQVAQAVRRPGQGKGKVDVLDGLHPKVLIAAGESQSAMRMATYVNAVHPMADIYDGFLVHSRGANGAQLSDNPVDNPVPEVAHIRADLDDPVLQFETETDLFLLDFAKAREDDTDRLRTWEVAGTAHADQTTIDYGVESGHTWNPDVDLDFSTTCGRLNEGPQGAVLRKGLDGLRTWIVDGTPPAKSPRIEVTATAVARDDHGNARRGTRTPAVDVPIATLTGERPPGDAIFCSLFGRTVPFDAATLRGLYPTHDDYVAKVQAAADEAVDAGFISTTDADAFVAAAEKSVVPTGSG